MKIALVIFVFLVQSYFLVVGEDRHEVLTPCIHIKQAISAEVDYQAMDGSINTVSIAGGNYTTTFTSCEYYTYSGNATATISWPSEDPFYSLTYYFHADFREGRWDFTRVLFHIITTDNPAFVDPEDDEIVLQNRHRIVADTIGATKSYQCDSNITRVFVSSNESSNNTARLQTRQTRIQVFRFTDNNGTFGSADMRCVDDISDSKVIPIIIGTLLTVMLVSISTLYIVGRIVKHQAEKKRSFVS